MRGAATQRPGATGGFTLVEMLVAMAVFALITAATAALFRSSLTAGEQVSSAHDRTRSLLLARAIIARDMAQMVPRPVRGRHGDQPGPGMAGGDALIGTDLIAFRRLGWSNPLQHPRGDVEAVRYRLQNGRLERVATLRPDPATDTATRTRLLLDGITSARIAFFADGRWHDGWQTGDITAGRLPAAMRLTLHHDRLGTIEQRFLLGGRP
ncbi:type II secretion system minor pseudopilin GspJ [Yunchengibacter salinarum]|uniref:type II secretion system minor pseudopilin GspJ n=1 Tax=Yunchengibacter salinarum TaxID=3133399 RepID=UPI0035B5F7A2